jgi:hypothetical protein
MTWVRTSRAAPASAARRATSLGFGWRWPWLGLALRQGEVGDERAAAARQLDELRLVALGVARDDERARPVVEAVGDRRHRPVRDRGRVDLRLSVVDERDPRRPRVARQLARLDREAVERVQVAPGAVRAEEQLREAPRAGMDVAARRIASSRPGSTPCSPSSTKTPPPASTSSRRARVVTRQPDDARRGFAKGPPLPSTSSSRLIRP